MNKYLLPLVLGCIAVPLARADVLYNEKFNYADGPLILVGTNLDGTTNWFRHSGTANPSDSTVKSKKLEISATGGSVSRQDDVHRNFTSFTNTQTILYAGLTVNCTNPPPSVGTYIGHFYVNTTTFHARLYAQAGSLTNTWRLGISGAAGTVNKVYPVDLALNTDYQVVVQWDPVTTFAATLWVNPVGPGDLSVTSGDIVSTPAASVGYGFRQAGTFGSAFFNITNNVVATTFDEASTNVWDTNAVAPLIVNQPKAGTNFVGDSFDLSAVAAGQGALTYQWQKNNSNITNPNGNSNVLSVVSAVVSDSGDYRVIATTPYGLSATSAVAFRWVTNAPVPPTITPTNNSTVTVFFHQSTTLQVSASGPPTISYQWYYTNTPIGGANSDSLTISDVLATNGTAGPYYAVASNPYGSATSGVFTVSAVGPPAVSIAYLRTLVDPSTFVATNSVLRWTITNVTVTTLTNLTTGDTSSYYVQDASGAGINIFTTRGGLFRPAQGTILDFTGFLSTFNSNLELTGDTNDSSTSVFVHTNLDGSPVIGPLPAPKVIPFGSTNDLAFSEYKLEAATVMLTNVYFGTNAGNAIATNVNRPEVVVTNAAGETFILRFSTVDQDTAGQTLPAFAYSVIGVIEQNLNNTAVPRNAGFAIAVTRFSDIVTNPPPPFPINIHVTTPVVDWANVGWDNVNYSYGSNYSYSVLATPVSYEGKLSGAQESPPNGSTGSGFCRVIVSPDGSKITVNANFSGLSAPASAGHIHGPAGAGTNAGVLFPFSGVPANTSGSIPEQTFTLTPTQAGYLYNGLLYANFHNANFPGGEIRAQLYPSTSLPSSPLPNFQAKMQGVNEVPANGSTASGFCAVVFNPELSKITVNLNFSGLTTPATASHIHGPAGAGTNASVLFPFSGVPSATSGSIPEQSFTLTPTQVGYLYNGLLYANVHNSTFPGGEIRAQLYPGPSTVPQASFQAVMLGINENPANGSTATGFGTVTLSPDQTSMTVNMRFSGISANATAAHIHGPAGAGTNASVIWGFSGVPSAKSGAIPEQTFVLTNATHIGWLQSGLLYMNVHNSIFPGGEIRGQILLVPSVGLTFANSSFSNTTPTTATYTDFSTQSGPIRFYRVSSP